MIARLVRGRKAKSSHWQSDSTHLELCVAMAMGSTKGNLTSLFVLSGIRRAVGRFIVTLILIFYTTFMS